VLAVELDVFLDSFDFLKCALERGVLVDSIKDESFVVVGI
jgi:hypothetical protein